MIEKFKSLFTKTNFGNLLFLFGVPSSMMLGIYLSSALLFLASVFVLPFIIARFNKLTFTKDRKRLSENGEDITTKLSISIAKSFIGLIAGMIIAYIFAFKLTALIGLDAGEYTEAIAVFLILLIPISIFILNNIPFSFFFRLDPYADYSEYHNDHPKKSKFSESRVGCMLSIGDGRVPMSIRMNNLKR